MASSVDAKLLKSTKFPLEYSKKVDMQKVNLEVMNQWIAQRVVEILGSEDDVVIDFIFGMLEAERYPDPKQIQLNLTGFLEKDTPTFCKQLWTLLLSAQASAQGIPTELLEKKKEELRQQRIEAENAAALQRRQRDQEEGRSREIDSIREQERGERRRKPLPTQNAYRPPPPRRSQSPPDPRRRSPDSYRSSRREEASYTSSRGERRDRFDHGGRRETDTYIPLRRGAYRHDFDDREDRGYKRYGRSRSRARSPRHSRKVSYHRESHRRRSSYSSSSPEYRRAKRRRTRSKSADESRRGRSDRDRHYSTTSYTSESTSRSGSRSSSLESSKSASPQKVQRGRSVSSDHGSGARTGRRHSPSSPRSLHADNKKGSDDKRRRSHERSYRHRSEDEGADSSRRIGREGGTNSVSKRSRLHERDGRDVSPKGSSSYKQRNIDGNDSQIDPKQRENQLREQLLRDKIKRSRKSSNTNED